MPAQSVVYEPDPPLAAVAGDGAWSPHVDVRELPDEYIVLADLPGVEPGAVAVTSKGDTLTINGARRDRLHAGGVPFRLERPTGKLRRSVPLPGPYEPTKIRTQIRDAVLEIRVPSRRTRTSPRRDRGSCQMRFPPAPKFGHIGWCHDRQRHGSSRAR